MTTLSITGMTCGHCKKAVEDALQGVAGVEKVSVDLDQGSASIEGKAELSQLIAAVLEEGYGATAS